MPKWYPLEWPQGYPRSEDVRSSKFKTSFDRALAETRAELRRLGATSLVVSTNLPLARDGFPDSRARLKNNDPGVAVYWMLGGKMHVIACDAWDRVEDNLHAIRLTLDADRGKARWGCSAVLDRAMAAYQALPAPPKPRDWWEVLGFTSKPTLERAEAAYRDQIRTAHPDVGGSHERMTELNRALEEARKEKNGSHS
jgi:hypothetical protein